MRFLGGKIMFEKTDCFGYEEGKCNVLKDYMVKNCEGCRFYKTKEQIFRGREKAKTRINMLDREKRMHIVEKYGTQE
jgi:hypothetical protein